MLIVADSWRKYQLFIVKRSLKFSLIIDNIPSQKDMSVEIPRHMNSGGEIDKLWWCLVTIEYTDGSYRENNENLLFLMTMTTWERISKEKKEIQASLTAWSLKSDFIPTWRISFSNRTPVFLNTNLSTKRGAYKMRTVPPTARQHLPIAR